MEDRLNFHFYSGSGGHSVVSGPFDNPCEPDGSFFSGYIKGDQTGVHTLSQPGVTILTVTRIQRSSSRSTQQIPSGSTAPSVLTAWMAW